MLNKNLAEIFLLIVFISSGEANPDELSLSDIDSQSSTPLSLPQSYPTCFSEGTTWSSDEAVDVVPEIPLPSSCQALCLHSSSCRHFTWYYQTSPFALSCYLFGSTTAEFPCLGCVSGPQTCTCGAQFTCQYTDDNFVGEFSHVETETICQDHCLKSEQCQFYTWLDEDSDDFPNVCLMFSSCEEKLFGCDTCHSGLADCSNISVITSTTPSLSSTTTTPSITSTTTTPPITSTSTTPPTTSTPSTTSTSTTPPHQTCEAPKPPNHGDWFCLPSISPSTCHLECNPGYVSSDITIITCHQGEWSSSPNCVTAVALITGNLDSPSNTVEVYGAQLHQKLPALPDDREGHSLALVNSVVLLCGGWYTLTSCLALTPEQQWIPHSNTIAERTEYSSVAMLGRLYLLGGEFFSISSEYLSPPSDQWQTGLDLLQPTGYDCTAKISAEVFVTTGGSSYPRSVVSYNVLTGETTRLQDLIKGRSSHGCVYMKEPATGMGKIVVAGGFDDVDAISSGEIYDIVTGEWATTGELTARRAGVKMLVIGESVLALGGYDGYKGLSSVDKFNSTSMQWAATENMLEARSSHAVAGVPPSAMGIYHK